MKHFPESRIQPASSLAKVNRRAFLRVAGTSIAVGLPFLEGLPERSAWAAGSEPVFTLMMVAACGVVGSKFFPSATGALTTASIGTDRATSVLAPHAANLMFIKGVNWPMAGVTGCGHAQGLCQSLTATPSEGSANSAYSTGISADMVIAKAVNANGGDPLTLYAGGKNYIAERISFKGAGAGQVRAADANPYTLYSKIIGLTTSTPTTGGGTTADPAAAALIASKKSVNDLVRNELKALMANTALSSADRQRLQLHFDTIRDAEVTMGTMAASCSKDGLDTTKLDSLKSGYAFKMDGMIEDIVKLHLSLVAVAFACNYNRVATLQWGDGTDGTKYSVPSNASLNWPFHHISHRVASDSATGSNPTAEAAHAEIDALRMKTLLAGLDAFKARGLSDKSIIMWTNHVSDGPSHSFKNVPHIIWGNGGGYLKTGQYIDAGNVTNNKLLNTVITAAIRDKSTETVNFGKATGTGEIAAMKA
ncbi:MAG TPA: DUF1552 domain-containing protein [Polyangiaceae bacterium]|nr:DUF1552 domain-containing protein [Polyangiaceae bacterium]